MIGAEILNCKIILFKRRTIISKVENIIIVNKTQKNAIATTEIETGYLES